MARKDTINWLHARLADNRGEERASVWNSIRSQQKGWQCKKTRLVVGGKAMPWSQTHIAFCEHLENKQWRQSSTSGDNLATLQQRKKLRDTQSAFTLEELQSALTKLKSNKAPGPDGISSDLFSLLDDTNTDRLLEFYNAIWDKGEVPDEWKEAIVISIYQGQRLDTDPSNYRPIALLNAINSIFASMLQARLAVRHESDLRKSQYGLRAHKSTTHPLFVLRWAMQWSEMTANPLYLLFLDWKQAFDSIDHNAMMSALERFGVSSRAQKIYLVNLQGPYILHYIVIR